MTQQKSQIKLQVAQGNLLHGLSIQVQAGYGGHLQDGMSGKCKFFFFKKKNKSSPKGNSDSLVSDGVTSTPRRAHFAICCRVWLKNTF